MAAAGLVGPAVTPAGGTATRTSSGRPETASSADSGFAGLLGGLAILPAASPTSTPTVDANRARITDATVQHALPTVDAPAITDSGGLNAAPSAQVTSDGANRTQAGGRLFAAGPSASAPTSAVPMVIPAPGGLSIQVAPTAGDAAHGPSALPHDAPTARGPAASPVMPMDAGLQAAPKRVEAPLASVTSRLGDAPRPNTPVMTPDAPSGPPGTADSEQAHGNLQSMHLATRAVPAGLLPVPTGVAGPTTQLAVPAVATADAHAAPASLMPVDPSPDGRAGPPPTPITVTERAVDAATPTPQTAASPNLNVAVTGTPQLAPTVAAAAAPMVVATPTPIPMQPDALAGQVAWQLRDGIAQATVRLDPEGLGHLDISVETEGEQAKLIFAARRPETADLLHQHLPRLQAALAESGFSGLEVDIRRDDRGGEANRQAPDPRPSHGNSPRSSHTESVERAVTAWADGHLDAWA